MTVAIQTYDVSKEQAAPFGVQLLTSMHVYFKDNM